MNVFDFDGTIFYRDSSHLFSMHCLRKYPLRCLAALLPALPKELYNLLFIRDAVATKEFLFSYLKNIPDADREIKVFWDEYFSKIEEWYLKIRREDDIIISASPDFIVRPAAQRLGVRLLASEVDRKSGRYLGKNCHDREKVRRFYLELPDGVIDSFYSDSLNDTPLAEIAKQAFMVRRGRIIPWPGINE